MLTSKLIVILALTAWVDQTGASPRAEDDPRNSIGGVAGTYYLGDGLGINCSLTIRPEGRFSFGWRGCLGVYDQNAGGARVVAGHLILSPERPNGRGGVFGTPTDFQIVTWGNRRYLVPESEKRSFCDHVNQGFEPRNSAHGLHYLRADDWQKQVVGPPDVPLDWRPLLLKGPLQGIVVEVLPGGRAKVEFGTTQGIRKGLDLWIDTKGFGLVEVVEVAEKTCVVAKYADLSGVHFEAGQWVAPTP